MSDAMQPVTVDDLLTELVGESKKVERESLARQLRELLADEAELAHAAALTSLEGGKLESTQAAYDTGYAAGKADAEAAAPPTPVTPAAPAFTPIGSLSGSTFVLGEVEGFDTFWQRAGEARGNYVVDFTGDKAEYFATRERHYKNERLPNGTWRLYVADKYTAGMVAAGAKPIVNQEGLNTKITEHSITSSRHVVEDATRGKSAAILDAAASFPALALHANGGLTVSASADGKTIQIALA